MSLHKATYALALGGALMFIATPARADCFDDVYNLYLTTSTTTYQVSSTRNTGDLSFFSSGFLYAMSGTTFASGMRGGPGWTGYPWRTSPTFSVVSGVNMYVLLDFANRKMTLSVPAWSYTSGARDVTCVNTRIMQVSDGFNAFLVSFGGS